MSQVIGPIPDAGRLRELAVDEQRRLIVRRDGSNNTEVVLGNGWRDSEKAEPVLPGMIGTEPRNDLFGSRIPAAWYPQLIKGCVRDGHRWIRLEHRRYGDEEHADAPVVWFDDALDELRLLLDSVGRDPLSMLNREDRQRAWKTQLPDRPPLVSIAEGILCRFHPWPFPFQERSGTDKSLNAHAVKECVIELFDRILDASTQTEPTGIATEFLALIQQRKAEWTCWMLPVAEAWGFKIRTRRGYNWRSWLKGTIWVQPDVPDDQVNEIVFASDGSSVTAGQVRCCLEMCSD